MSRLLGLKQVPVFQELGDAKVTTEFGYNIPDYPTTGQYGDHLALDIVRCPDGQSSEGATIIAPADGIIYAQRKWVKGFNKTYSAGNCVYIWHPQTGLVSKYFHLKYGSVPDWVADDVPVQKGQIIGEMGDTGYAYGVHLHFQVEALSDLENPKSGSPIDPEPYLMGTKFFDKVPEYFVKIGMFSTLEEAQAIQTGLAILGTDSTIEQLN